MKKIKFFNIALFLFAAITLISCTSDNEAIDPLVNLHVGTVTTNPVTEIETTSALSGGNVTSDGASPITARGVVWSTSHNPTILDSKTTDGSGMGSFSSLIVGLTPNTLYYTRAYATNAYGTYYGSEISFKTAAVIVPPVLTTTSVTNITSSTASSGGNIVSDGGLPIIARGIVWNTTPNPTTANTFTTDGTGTGTFVSSLTGLNSSTTYYIRAYATTSNGTFYGTQVTFTTAAVITLTTTPVTNVTASSATSGGNITSGGSSAITMRGVVWSTTPNPTTANSMTMDGTGIGSFSSSIVGLNANTLYYVKAYATNSSGTVYGNEVTFTTLP